MFGIIICLQKEEGLKLYLFVLGIYFKHLVWSLTLRVMSIGVETYGCWSEHSLALRQLAGAKANRVPEVLGRSAQHAFAARWWALLGVAVQKTICTSILGPVGADLLQAEGSVAETPPRTFWNSTGESLKTASGSVHGASLRLGRVYPVHLRHVVHARS